MKKKIAIYTSTRADFGILKPLISKLIQLQKFDVRIFVTGTHLDPEFGSTVTEIEKFFPKEIFYRVQQSMKEDARAKNLFVMSEAIQKYTEALVANPVDLAIVLGDRYEALCFGLVCASLGLPIVHLHGGELTLGAIDDKFRHCLTKLSNWHFVACETYRQRVIQLGEQPDTVFNVGALGVDNALSQKLMSVEELKANLGVDFKNFNELYLFTFHPETNAKDYGAELLKTFLSGLSKRLSSHNGLVVITGVNSDPGCEMIKEILQQFQNENAKHVFFKESLGVVRYLSVMKLATAVLGNSSSGILEAHSMKTPAVNLGHRQLGRERETSVIDLMLPSDCLKIDFDKLVELKISLAHSTMVKSIFGNGQASTLITKNIEEILQKNTFNRTKEFFDLQD